MMHLQSVLLSTVLLLAWSLLPSCGGRQDEGGFVKREIEDIKSLTIPDGTYPPDGSAKPSGLYGVEAVWEFDTPMSSEAYIRWVSSRLEPAFTPRTNSQPPFLFSKYCGGDEEIIQIVTTLRSEKLHVLVTLDMYPD